MTRPDAILSVDGLDAGYDEAQILHNVSVEVATGAIVAIIGPNGAGKSTLLKAIYGLATVTDGRVHLKLPDRPVTDLRGLRPDRITASGINYVPQLRNVFPDMTIMENLEIGGMLEPRRFDERLSQVQDLFPILRERTSQRAGTLSGGQRQMLALARALMTGPELLLLDEPSAGLAPSVIDEVMERLIEIRERGVSLLMVEQNARRSLAMADYGYVLEAGHNRFEGPGRELLDDPTVVDLYLGG